VLSGPYAKFCRPYSAVLSLARETGAQLLADTARQALVAMLQVVGESATCLAACVG
jgi:hypothetical protein